MTPMKPTIGRIVHYTLEEIATAAGYVRAAIITNVYTERVVELVVFTSKLDQMSPTLHRDSVEIAEDNEPARGRWHWPATNGSEQVTFVTAAAQEDAPDDVVAPAVVVEAPVTTAAVVASMDAVAAPEPEEPAVAVAAHEL